MTIACNRRILRDNGTGRLRSSQVRICRLTACHLYLFMIALVMFAFTPSPGMAQGLNGAFSGFSTDSNEPINIESDSLEVNDAKKTAVFLGNVIAVQGDMEMRTPELEVTYSAQVSGNNGKNSSGGGSQLTRLRAKKKVLITSKNNQTAKSDWADFDVKKQLITIGGNVVVSQGDTIMKGERLVIDLKSGRSRFETDKKSGGGGRVRGIFHPKKKSRSQAGTKVKKSKSAVIDGWSTTN